MAEAVKDRPKEHFFADLEKLASNGYSAWLKRIRAAGAQRFREMDYPNTRLEEWRQTNIAPIVNTPYRSLIAPSPVLPRANEVAPFFYDPDAWTELVFVNGFFAPALSVVRALPSGVRIRGLAAALHGPQAGLVESYLNTCLRDRNAYTALNTAFLQDGAFVYVPGNTVLESPIHFIFVTGDRPSNTASHIRNLIVLEDSSQATLLTSYVSLAGRTPYLNNIVEEVVLGANAELSSCAVIEEGEEGNHLATTEIRQGRDSRQLSFTVSIGGRITRRQQCTDLEGEGADCYLYGLYLNDEDRLIDNTLNITHFKPHGSSRIACKGILDGTSKAVYGGKIYVHREAQQTDSKQLNNNLLLSDTATVDTKPQLEIYADDVKCTHGATVGGPPEEVLFYFRSRGMREETARGMLTCGFADEIVSQIDVRPVRDRLHRKVVAKYAPAQVG